MPERERRRWPDVPTMRADAKARSEAYRAASPAALRQAGIPFTADKDGKYLFVADEWHFWPSNGKWLRRLDRPPREEGRGVFNLINRIKSP